MSTNADTPAILERRQRFAGHPVHVSLGELENLLTVVGRDIDPGMGSHLDVARLGLMAAVDKMAAADPILTTPSMLDSLQQALQNLISNLSTYLQNRDVNQILALNNNADVVLDVLRMWPLDATGKRVAEELDAVRADADQLKAVIDGRKIDFDVFATAQQQLIQEVLAQVREKDAAASALVSELEEKRDAAKDLLDVIGTDTLTAAYDQQAERERRARNWLRGLSAAFSVGAIIPLSVAIATTEGDSFGGGKFLAKLGLGLILGGIAAFLGRESGHHRKREQDYRKNALDLAAIGPYIELLDPATQKMIRLALAPRLFGPYSEAVANEQVSDALVREGLIRLMKDASPGSPGAPPMPPGAAP